MHLLLSHPLLHSVKYCIIQ